MSENDTGIDVVFAHAMILCDAYLMIASQRALASSKAAAYLSGAGLSPMSTSVMSNWAEGSLTGPVTGEDVGEGVTGAAVTGEEVGEGVTGAAVTTLTHVPLSHSQPAVSLQGFAFKPTHCAWASATNVAELRKEKRKVVETFMVL